MLFFAVVNTVAFIATLLFVPSMPVANKPSYGVQLRVLRRSAVWLSITAVIFMNGAVFGVYSYLAEYLEIVTHLTWNTISLMLFFYGAANMVGNIIAGGRYSSCIKYNKAISVCIRWRLHPHVNPRPVQRTNGLHDSDLGSIGRDRRQYYSILIVASAPDAPEFANGIFLTSANLGTTIGASVCGLFITGIGAPYVLLGGSCLLY